MTPSHSPASLLRYGFLVGLGLLLGCESKEAAAAHKQAVEQVAGEQLAKIEKEVTEARAKSDAGAHARAAEAKELLAKFHIEKDKFEDRITYTHKNFRLDGNVGIRANIFTNSLSLAAHYHGQEWRFIDRVIVKIGDQKQEFTGRPKRDVLGGTVFETLFLEGDSKNLAKFIADSDPSAEVLVRLSGKSNKDFVLSKKDRQGLVDTWQLSKVMNPGLQ